MSTILPQQIPPQATPFDTKGQTFVSLDWYLFLYNMALQTLPQQNGTVPTSEADIIDMIDLDAAGSDVPQAYRQVQNEALLADQEAQTIGSDVAGLPQRDINVQALLTDSDIGPSLQDFANALLLASDGLLQDPMPPAGPVIPITPGASPFTYTAIHDGTICISGPPSATINVIRYGTTVPTGMTEGTIPMRKNDQVSISWSGGTAPVMNYLPNK